MDERRLTQAIGTAILGLDTLWGGDVMNPSGAGRFIADSWCSDEPLPLAYRHEAAARLRATGGVAAGAPDLAAIDAYLRAVDLPAAIAEVAALGRGAGALRGAFLAGLAESLEVMWGLSQERLGRGPAVPYARCVLACTGRPPSPSRPEERRERLQALLGVAGEARGAPGELLAAADRWRAERLVPRKALRLLADALVAQLDAMAAARVAPHLPAALREVPRANVAFLPIEGAWFSGSMNYLGRARTPAGAPRYEATYEVNAALEISVPELVQLVSHEVVPGHLMTFALAHALHARGRVGFEATVLTMNTRFATLSEGIANNAILMAYGAREVAELPEPDLQIGTLLALLQDDAKNQASWLTWEERRPREEVAAALRRDFLVSEERADKLSGAWGRHPLLGRAYLPAYRAGTEKVAGLLARVEPARLYPVLFGAEGLVDVVTVDQALGA